MSDGYDELVAYVTNHFDADVVEAAKSFSKLGAGTQRKFFLRIRRRIALQQIRERELERARKATHARDDYAREKPLNRKGARGNAVRRIRALIKQKTGMVRVPQQLVVAVAAEVLECSEEEVHNAIKYGYRL